MGEFRFEPFGTAQEATTYLRALIDGADEEILLTASRRLLEAIRPALVDAVDRGVLVLLLLGEIQDGEDAATDFTDAARVVHAWEDDTPISIICTVDDREGLCMSELLLSEELGTDAGIVFSHPLLNAHLFSTVIGNTWNRAPEVYTSDPDPLPATYTNFSAAVVNATLHRRNGQHLHVTVEGNRVGTTESTVIEGHLCNVRQSFVSPITNSFPVENSIFVRTADDEVLTVGGPGAFVEDIEASEVRLEPSAFDDGSATGR